MRECLSEGSAGVKEVLECLSEGSAGVLEFWSLDVMDHWFSDQ